jgi:hypothetical protein
LIDVSNPTTPLFLGVYDTPGEASAVAVAGDLVCVADGLSGLHLIDVSSPSAPGLLGTYDTPGEADDVVVQGDVAYVADRLSGIRIVDISNPAEPSLLGYYDTSSSVRGVAVSGDVAYLADSSVLLQAVQVRQREVDGSANVAQSLDVDGSSAVVLEARLTASSTESIAWGLSADGGAHWQAVLPDGNWNVFTHPGHDLRWRATLSWTAPGGPSVSWLQIDWLEAGVPASGPDEPMSFALEEGAPNPFRRSTSISFRLGEPRHTRLRIYDVRGRLVSTLIDGVLPTGRHRTLWSGSREERTFVSPGVYYLTMESGEFRAVRKLMLVR